MTKRTLCQTAADGQYHFAFLFRGLYRVRQVVPVGWVQTTPDPADIDLLSGQVYAAFADQTSPDDTGTTSSSTRVWPSAACNGP